MTPADHPPTCRICHGTGYQPGPDNIHRDDNGHIIRTSTTVTACTHHWTEDDPTPDEAIDLDTYLTRYPDDDALARSRHPSARTGGTL
jgi:hypothetical protein